MDFSTVVLASVAGDAVRWLIFIIAAPLILLGWYTFLKKMGSF
jgi:hypothetical protein